MRRAAWALLAVMICGSAFTTTGAMAQSSLMTPESYLRVEWALDQSKSGRPRLTGYVYNPRDLWATRVLLVVETLDGAGQVVASTNTWVYGNVPPRNRSYFETPLSATGATYRVMVRSVDWRGYGLGGD